MTENKMEWFKAAIGNPEYLMEISKNKSSQTQFIKTLEEEHLAPLDVFESLQIVENHQVRSLLIIYLLSQKEYLSSLKGESILDRLAVHQNHIPSRLNQLVHELDSKILTINLIEKLEPEAAVSLLCSLPHFSQLTREQTEALINKSPKHGVISYWLNHFALMPNAYFILAHLIRITGYRVFDELIQLDHHLRDSIINQILKHLKLFPSTLCNPRSHQLANLPSFINLASEESHLITAMQLYLNGHYNKAYITYIVQLAKKLLEGRYFFSFTATELFFFINDKLDFRELTDKTACLIGDYLKTNAQKGHIELFYQNNQLNIPRMVQNISLNATSTMNFEKIGSTTCLEYFLMQYRGDLASLSKLLNEFMTFFGRQRSAKNKLQIIYQLSSMLMYPELNLEIKEVIFTSLLNHPYFFNESIGKQLFLFDAKKTIQYFGLQGGAKNYQIVIDLCTWSLKQLTNQQEIIHMTRQALSEAQLELSFIKKQGFFSSVIKFLKRCWLYGWKGFFKPNLPKYVVSESLILKKNENKLLKKQLEDYTPSFSPLKQKDLNTFLNEITLPLNQEQFENMIELLNSYSSQAVQKKEFLIRQKVHNLYHQSINKKENEVLSQWLKENQNPFIANQFRLLELTLKEKTLYEVNLLLDEIIKDTDQLQYIAEELNSTIPELIAKKIPQFEKEAETDFVTNTTRMISQYATEATKYANCAWSWTGKLTENLFAKKEPKTEFIAEHTPSFKELMTKKN